MAIAADPDERAARQRRRSSRSRWRLTRSLLHLVQGVLLVVLLLPLFIVAVLSEVNPPYSSFMAIAWLEARSEGRTGFRLHYDWVDWEAIAPAMRLAVVAAEDQRFPQHLGFDLDAIRAAWRHNRAGGSVRGASTISQQVAKNLLLWPQRSYLRKGLEAYCTALVELLWSKRRILEVYLNIAQFGDGVYGVGAAANLYFGKEAAALTPREAAQLAAVLPNPLRLRADKPSAYVAKRRQWILTQMERLGGDSYLSGL